MKFLILAVIFVTANALTPDQVAKADEHTQFCSTDVGLSYDDAKKLRFNVISDEDTKNQCFTKCFMERSEFMDADGNLIMTNILEKLGSALDDAGKEKLRGVVEKCSSITGDDRCNRAFKVHNCYWTNINEE